MSTAPSTPVKPICYYNFEAANGQLTDLSGNGYDATLPTSGVNAINDPIMGSCLQFNGTTGDFIKINNLPPPLSKNPEPFNGLTMTALVNVSAANGLTSLLQLGTSKVVSPSGQENKYTGYAQLTINNTKLNYRWWGNGGKQIGVDAISLNSWLHLAVTVDTNGETIFYVQGNTKPKWQFKKDQDLKSNGALGWSFGNIGADGTQPTTANVFTGKMAWAGFYQGVMSQSDIQKEIELGKSNRHFVSNRSFPVDFKLFSDDAGAYSPIMFIDSAGLDQTLDFHLVNSGKKPLSIPVGTGTVDATDNYHFQLRFRPGILSEKYVTKHTQGTTTAEPLLASTSWSTLLSKDSSNNDVMSFLYTGSAAMSIDVGKEFVLQLDNINASATGGSKNTNVEFKYQGIDYGLSGTSAPQIEGYRTQNISIVNHTGEKNIPLRAEIAGMASIMTYHQSSGQSAPTSELLFHLINTGTEAIDLGTSSSTDGATAFTLSVDVQPQNEFMDWALFAQGEGNPTIVLNVIGVVRSFNGTDTITLGSPLTKALDANTTLQIDGVSDTVTVGASGAPAGAYTIPVSTTATSMTEGAVISPSSGSDAWAVSPDSAVPAIVDNQMQWTITNNTATSFEAGKGLSFMLTGIECSLPAGTSKITIGYSNIPGHWDGSFALPVQKSPLAFNENLMGINTQEPKAHLHIVEENGNVPFRVENNKAVFPPVMVTTYNPVGNLVWKEGQTFYDSTVYFDNSKNLGYLNIWTIDGANTVCTPVNLPKEDKPVDELTYGFAHWYYGYFYVISNNGGTINAYSLSDGIATCKGSSNNLPPNATDKVYPIPNIANYGDYLYSMDSYKSSIFDLFDISESSVAQPQAKTISLSSYSNYNNYNIVQVLTDGSYVYLLGIDRLFINTVKPSGDLDRISSISYNPNYAGQRNYASAQIHGTFVYIKFVDTDSENYKSWIFIIDISDPTSLSVYNSINLSSHPGAGNINEQTLVFYKNSMIVNFDEGLVIFDLTAPIQTNPPRVLPLPGWKKIKNIAFAGGMFFSSGYTKNYKNICLVYDAEKIFANLFEHSTLISSEAITIGANEIDDKASLSVPYPLSDGYNGIAIGDTTAGESAALSISVSHGAAQDPMAVNDESGNPIFNIKQPTADGQPYRVGIGTDNPKVPLHIEGGVSYTASAPFGFLNSITLASNPSAYSGVSESAQAPATSIYASGTIQALQFFAVSDLRIKDMVQVSNTDPDLSTLMKLQVSDYQYIDFVGKGTGQKKGLIAQQVKEHFPQAVSAENTDFIPDIYAMATDLGWQPITKHLRVSLEKAHDLEVGDKVRLIADKGFEEKKVVAIPNDQSFVISEWEKPVEQLFVFGKEVHDFHTVDYDQVAMLGVSAIQALHAQMQDLKKENEALKAQMQSEMSELKEEWAAYKSSLTPQHQN